MEKRLRGSDVDELLAKEILCSVFNYQYLKKIDKPDLQGRDDNCEEVGVEVVCTVNQSAQHRTKKAVSNGQIVCYYPDSDNLNLSPNMAHCENYLCVEQDIINAINKKIEKLNNGNYSSFSNIDLFVNSWAFHKVCSPGYNINILIAKMREGFNRNKCNYRYIYILCYGFIIKFDKELSATIYTCPCNYVYDEETKIIKRKDEKL